MSEDASHSRKRKHWFNSGNSQNKKQCTDLFYSGSVKGVLVTCNLKEKECLRETYSLLNEYSDRLVSDEGKNGADGTDQDNDTNGKSTSSPEHVDIESELQKEVALLKNPVAKKFRQIPTKCKNIIFVQILNGLDPYLFIHSILSDITSSCEGKARYANRMTPVQETCKATIQSVESTLKRLLEANMANLKEESTFMILCKVRNNDDVRRMDFVDAGAAVVRSLRPKWKVDFDSPDVTIAIDVIIKVCFIGILTDFLKFRKYNLIEYASFCRKKQNEAKANPVPVPEQVEAKEGSTLITSDQVPESVSN